MNLFDYCKAKRVKVNFACEVGYDELKHSQIKGFIENGTECMVIDLTSCNDIMHKMNVGIYCYGIGFKEKKNQQFNLNGASTYMDGILSPAVINKGHGPKADRVIFRDVHTFDEFDTGTIDAISIDIEGLEYAVLKKMKSRPEIISIEMKWRKYKNPYFKNIRAWMRYHGYKKVAINGSDEIYRRSA